MMKKLGLFTLGLFAAAQLACVVESVPVEGEFLASWDVRLDTGDGMGFISVVDFCTEAHRLATTVEVLVTDSLGAGTAIELTCDDFSGSTGLLPTDDYFVVYSVLDDNLNSLPEGNGDACLVNLPGTSYALDRASVTLPSVVFDFTSDPNVCP